MLIASVRETDQEDIVVDSVLLDQPEIDVRFHGDAVLNQAVRVTVSMTNPLGIPPRAPGGVMAWSWPGKESTNEAEVSFL